MTGRLSDGRLDRLDRWIVLSVMAGGLALRLYHLGDLGLTGNEDYAVISAHGILEHGIPLFPSGVIYPRAVPLSYLVAACIALLGNTEFAARLPSVLFSTAMIGAVWLLGRRMADRRVALVAALLICISDWEIVVGRTARMYAMFSLFYLLAIYFTFRAAVDGGGSNRAGAVVSNVIAVITHRIAATLIVVHGLFAVMLWRRPRGRTAALVAIAVVLLTTLADSIWTRAQYSRWEDLVQENFPGDEGDGGMAKAGLRRVLSQRVLPLFLDVAQHRSVLFSLLTVFVVATVAACAWRMLRHGADRLFPAALAAAAVALYLQQALLAALVLVAYAVLGRRVTPERWLRNTMVLAAVVVIGSAAWLVYGAVGAVDPSFPTDLLSRARRSLRALVGYPANFGEFFIRRYPLQAVLAGVGAAVALMRVARKRGVGTELYLLVVLVVPTFTMGFHPTALIRFYERYAFFLNPYFVLLAAYGMVWVTEVARSRGRIPAFACCAALVFVFGLQMTRAWDAVHLQYGENRALREAYGEPIFYPDHDGPSRYVRRHYRPGDRVLAMDILIHYAYFPKADGQLTVTTKGDAEGWIGVGTLRTAGALEAWLDASEGARTWVVLSGAQLGRFNEDAELRRILSVLRDRGRVAYRGRDGFSDVVLVEGARAGSISLTSGLSRRSDRNRTISPNSPRDASWTPMTVNSTPSRRSGRSVSGTLKASRSAASHAHTTTPRKATTMPISPKNRRGLRVNRVRKSTLRRSSSRRA